MLRAENFGINLARIRTKRNMKQREIAEALYLTPQTVSKWEQGQTFPELANVIRIADILNVSVEELLKEPEKGEKRSLFLGIDGGGTKTEGVLFDGDGTVLHRVLQSASNPNAVGIEEAAHSLKLCISQLLSGGEKPEGAFLGISGAGSPKNREELKRILADEFPKLKTVVDSDIVSVFHSVAPMKKAVAVICGTGSVVFANDGERFHQVGGYGYLFDKSGSGFDIGCDVLRYCMRCGDGMETPGLLAELAERKLGGKPKKMIPELYKRGNSYLASFSVPAFDAYRGGDPAARKIVTENIRTLGQMIRHAVTTYDCGRTVIFSGGMKQEKEILEPILRGCLPEDVKIVFPELPPIFGACVYARTAFGKEFDFDGFSERFRRSYHE